MGNTELEEDEKKSILRISNNASTKSNRNQDIQTPRRHVSTPAKPWPLNTNHQQDNGRETELDKSLRYAATVLVRGNGDTVAVSTNGYISIRSDSTDRSSVNQEGSTDPGRAVEQSSEVQAETHETSTKMEELELGEGEIAIPTFAMKDRGFATHVGMIQYLLRPLGKAKDQQTKLQRNSDMFVYTMMSSRNQNLARLQIAVAEVQKLIALDRVSRAQARPVPSSCIGKGKMFGQTTYTKWLESLKTALEQLKGGFEDLKDTVCAGNPAAAGYKSREIYNFFKDLGRLLDGEDEHSIALWQSSIVVALSWSWSSVGQFNEELDPDSDPASSNTSQAEPASHMSTV